jgi:hypothetical protein
LFACAPSDPDGAESSVPTAAVPVELCANDRDDDGDGAVDCADSD